MLDGIFSSIFFNDSWLISKRKKKCCKNFVLCNNANASSENWIINLQSCATGLIPVRISSPREKWQARYIATFKIDIILRAILGVARFARNLHKLCNCKIWKDCFDPFSLEIIFSKKKLDKFLFYFAKRTINIIHPPPIETWGSKKIKKHFVGSFYDYLRFVIINKKK